MRPNCPAAHSMDTTWFAVDADGNVGAFNTGEDGALPNDACAGPEAGKFDDWPLHAVLVARALAEGDFDVTEDTDRDQGSVHAVIVLAPDPVSEERVSYRDAAGLTYSVTEALRTPTLLIRDSGPRVVATRDTVGAKVLARIRALPRVERVVTSDAIWSWFEEDGDDGLYHFENTDYGEPGAYTRVRVPAAPLRADALPLDLAEAVSRLTLETSFADDDKLHLADHLSDDDCQTWGETGLYGSPEDETVSPPRTPTGLEGVPKPPAAPAGSPPRAATPEARRPDTPPSPSASTLVKVIAGVGFVVAVLFLITRWL